MKNLLVKAIISVFAIAVGFGAMVLPFQLFNNLTPGQMRILFIAEMIIYFAIFAGVLFFKEARAEKQRHAAELEERHNRRVEKRKKELKGIKVNNYDLAA